MAGKGIKDFTDTGDSHKTEPITDTDRTELEGDEVVLSGQEQLLSDEEKGLDPKSQKHVPSNESYGRRDSVLSFQSPKTKREVEKLTPQSLFEQHILKGSAMFLMSPCCTLVSAFSDCHDYKSKRLIRFFERSVKTRGGMEFSPTLERLRKNPRCLSQFELVVLGNYPFKKFAWRISTSNEDTAILGLLSYFSNIYKTRDIEFDKNMQDTEMLSSDLDPILKEEVLKLYKEIKAEWEKLQKDGPLLHELQAGISLINILDIGTGNAVRDFLPMLNRYCKWSMHLTCYKDDDTSLASTSPEECHTNPQALRCFKGCVNEEQVVMATRLECKEEKKPKEQWRNENIEQAIKKETGISVEHLSVPELEMEDTKMKLEETVVKSQFHSIVHLYELLLLQAIRKKSSRTFWMKRSDIEALAKQLKIINGSVDRFLRVFTLFGCLFHAHDIPALNEYVITDTFKFVQQMQQLYNETSRNGLFFKRRSSEDTKMMLRFLGNLGIALRVKSTQIQDAQIRDTSLPEDVYYYIPSARDCSHLSNDTTDDSIVISFDKCAAENLQLCLCHELLQTGGQLVPKEGDPSVTIVALQDTEIQFKESVKDVWITLLNEQAADVSRKIEIYSRILSRHPNLLTPSETKLSYKIHVSNELKALGISQEKFEEELSRIKNNTPCCMNPEIGDPIHIGRIADLLAEKYSDHLEILMDKFKITHNETLQSCGTKMRILYMLTEYLKTATTYQFNAMLTELGIQENTTKADLQDY